MSPQRIKSMVFIGGFKNCSSPDRATRMYTNAYHCYIKRTVSPIAADISLRCLCSYYTIVCASVSPVCRPCVAIYFKRYLSMQLDPEHYYDHGWEKIPNELLYSEFNAICWLLDFELCIYPGLNSREFNVTEIDNNLTIQYDKQQPRRFPLAELYFHK